MDTLPSIIIFTKDRPNTLIETLDGIKTEDFPIIVLDDSHLIKNQLINKERLKKYPNVTDHGGREQKNLFEKTGIDKNLLQRFVNQLGTRDWNLGYVRNYAVLLAKSLKLKSVLLMDDDIIVEDKTLIASMFKLLDKYDFVGAKVIGMIDDSVVGYIVRELNCVPVEYFSGGFLSFNVHVVSEYFMNQYNEDWIWLYLHQAKCSCYQYGEVRQLEYDHFKNAIEKAKNQEFGEMLVDGVKESLDQQDFYQLKNGLFWQKLLEEKQVFYEELKVISKEQGHAHFTDVLTEVANYSARLKTDTFTALFNQYFISREEWIDILKSL